jgi:hypothetical protein
MDEGAVYVYMYVLRWMVWMKIALGERVGGVNGIKDGRSVM